MDTLEVEIARMRWLLILAMRYNCKLLIEKYTKILAELEV